MVRPTSDDFFSPFFLLILFTFSASNEIYISSAEIRFLAAIFIISLSVDRRDRQGTKKRENMREKKRFVIGEHEIYHKLATINLNS